MPLTWPPFRYDGAYATEYTQNEYFLSEDALPYLMTLTSEHREGSDGWIKSQNNCSNPSSNPSAYALWQGLKSRVLSFTQFPDYESRRVPILLDCAFYMYM
jgi:hypothetical protein